jgi:BirA family biotin operon repressor/biotin-[acetyl-CoA-carboxylase] ligase
MTDPKLLDPDRLRARLRTKVLGSIVLAYDRAGSTNDIALAYAASAGRDADGALVLAEYQTAGRGRFGRRWFSPPGASLLFSLALCPGPRIVRPSLLTFSMGLSVRRAVAACTGAPAGLKWPNDVVIRGRKVSGVLTEAGRLGDSTHFWVVGVGVNVNTELGDFPPEVASAATSLRIECGRPCSREEVLVETLADFEAWYVQLQRGESDALLAQVRRHTTTLGRFVRVEGAAGTIEGTATDVDEDGALLVRTAFGRTFTAAWGETTVVDAVP